MRSLGKIVVRELEEQLQRQVREAERVTHAASFLQGGAALLERSRSSPELDVRLSASSVPFPTVAGLVGAMEGRRDASEELVKQQVLTAQLQYLRTANALVRDACRVALDQLLGHDQS